MIVAQKNHPSSLKKPHFDNFWINTGSPYSIGEKLILSAFKIVQNNLCEMTESILFSVIPLSYTPNRFKRRNDEWAKHLREELVVQVKYCKIKQF